MKTLAFLFVASLVFLFVGLLVSEGQPAPGLAVSALPPAPPPVPGSANLKRAVPPIQKPLVAIDPESPEFAAAIRAQDFCKVRTLGGSASSHIFPAALQRTMLEEIGASAALKELFAPNGPFYGEPGKVKTKSTLAKFYLALRLAGVYSPIEGNSPDFSAARALFLELESEDPGNGAFPYFRLSAERALKYGPEKLKDTAERIRLASHFDTLFISETRELEALKWQSPTNHYLISKLEMQLGGFDFYSSYATLLTLGEGNGDLETWRRPIGTLMMAAGERAHRGHHFSGFHGQTYAFGKILAQIDGKPHLDQLSEEIEGVAPPMAPYVWTVQKECPEDETKEYETYLEKMRGLF